MIWGYHHFRKHPHEGIETIAFLPVSSTQAFFVRLSNRRISQAPMVTAHTSAKKRLTELVGPALGWYSIILAGKNGLLKIIIPLNFRSDFSGNSPKTIQKDFGNESMSNGGIETRIHATNIEKKPQSLWNKMDMKAKICL